MAFTTQTRVDLDSVNGLPLTLADLNLILNPYARVRFDAVDGNNKLEFIDTDTGGFRMGFYDAGNWDNEASTP